MARTLKEATISTRNARAKLPVGLHWRGIDYGVHLGYRKGKRGGTWVVRWRNGDGYRQTPLGAPDDSLKAGTLDFDAAIRAARAAVEEARVEAAAASAGPALTISSAVSDYIARRDARASARAGRPCALILRSASAAMSSGGPRAVGRRRWRLPRSQRSRCTGSPSAT